MDDTRFDRLTRALVTRRAGFGLGLGALAGLAGVAEAKKKKKKNKKKKKKTCQQGCAECASCQNGKCQPVADGAACGSGDTCQAGVCAGSGGCGKGQKRCGAACIARDACCQDGEVCGDGAGRCLTGVCRAKPACLAKDKTYTYVGEPLCCSSNIGNASGKVLCLAGSPGDNCLSDSDCATGTCVGYRCRSCSGAACGPTYRFERAFAGPGSGQTALELPLQLAVNQAGNLLVADFRLHRVLELTPEGGFVRQLGVTGVEGSDNGHFRNPTGVAVDATGNIFVGDTGNARVQKFAPDGNWLLQIGTGVRGNATNQFDAPNFLAIDSRQLLAIGDGDNNRVQVFTTQGVFVGSITRSGMQGVVGVGVDSRDHLYVDASDKWWEFDASGAFVSTWPMPTAKEPVAFSPEGNIFTAHQGNDRTHEIIEWTAGRQFIRGLDPDPEPGAPVDVFSFGEGLAFDRAGNLYIAERVTSEEPVVDSHGRIVKFAVVPYAVASAGRKASGGGNKPRKHQAKRHRQQK